MSALQSQNEGEMASVVLSVARRAWLLEERKAKS